MLRMKSLIASFCLISAACGPALGAAITFTGSSAHRAASVNFEASGTDLIVTLTNTSVNDALVPIDILTGVFFDIGGAPLALTRTSAVLASGSVVHFGPVDPGNVVGGEWAYKDNVGGPGGRYYGISSSGLGLFGPGDLFPGSDLQPPTSVDGLQYGITSFGDNVATGNAPVTGGNALIQNSVVFTLSGLPNGFDPNGMIQSVLFQYGTDLSEPSFPGVPEPATATPLFIAGLLAIRRRGR